jgi:hypothetical protein
MINKRIREENESKNWLKKLEWINHSADLMGLIMLYIIHQAKLIGWDFVGFLSNIYSRYMHDTQMYNLYTCVLYVYEEESCEVEKYRMLTWVRYKPIILYT